ncbi:ribonuclease HI [bacterium]|nr:ribonuclease HI [bacterium]
MKSNVVIYTDGACSKNPGKGGYGIVLLYKKENGEQVQKNVSKGFQNTTNNRMELLAVIDALNLLKKPCKVTLCTDSKYVTEAINKGWLESWVKNNWRTNSKSKVKNVDLWQKFIQAKKDHDIEFIWVKGHHENEYNNLCDKLAVTAREKPNLEIDEGFEL